MYNYVKLRRIDVYLQEEDLTITIPMYVTDKVKDITGFIKDSLLYKINQLGFDFLFNGYKEFGGDDGGFNEIEIYLPVPIDNDLYLANQFWVQVDRSLINLDAPFWSQMIFQTYFL